MKVIAWIILLLMVILMILGLAQPEEAEGMKMGMLQYWFGK